MRPCFRLIPFSRDNAGIVLGWRNKSRIRSVMIDDSIIPEERHLRFLEALESDRTRAYFILEFDGHPVGAIYFSGIGQLQVTWGCYIGVEGIIPGLFPAMVLIAACYGFSFPETIELHSEVVANNAAPVRLNHYLGIEQIDGKWVKTSSGKELELLAFRLRRENLDPIMTKLITVMPVSVRKACQEFVAEY